MGENLEAVEGKMREISVVHIAPKVANGMRHCKRKV
jgi:hypothetical protein